MTIGRITFLLMLFFAAFTLAAVPVITSVVPPLGPAGGGTVVLIKGSGFSNHCIICSPPFADPEVKFGSTGVTSLKFIDEHTLEVVTPPALPGRVSVTVRQYDGSPEPVTLANAFTYLDTEEQAFDPILLPVFLPETNGAFGSRFVTAARVWHKGGPAPITLFGDDTSCFFTSPPTHSLQPLLLGPGDAEHTLQTGCSHSVGRVFWVSKNHFGLAASLRVTDVSREASSLGVEVPVVTADRFSITVALLNVPVDPRYRHTLRIYSLQREPVSATVAFNGQNHRELTLTPGRDMFEPAYAELTDFPITPGQTSMRVTVSSNVPIWALASVTNNETQAITTVTPQP